MTFYSRLHCGPSDDFCVLLFHGQGFEHDRVFTLYVLRSVVVLYKKPSLLGLPKNANTDHAFQQLPTTPHTPHSVTHTLPKKRRKGKFTCKLATIPPGNRSETELQQKQELATAPQSGIFVVKRRFTCHISGWGWVVRGARWSSLFFNLFIFICVCKIVGLILVNTATHLHAHTHTHTQCH